MGVTDFFLIWKITEIQKGLRNDFRFMICGMSTQLVNPPLSEKKIPPPPPHRQMGVTGIFFNLKISNIMKKLKNDYKKVW